MELYYSRPYVNTYIAGAFFLILFSFYHLFIRRWRAAATTQKRLPPEVGGAWPIIGHLRQFTGPQLPHITTGALADIYGPIFRVRLGVHRAVILSSSELARELFTSHDLIALTRPDSIAATHLGYDGAMFGFASYGPYWRALRKIISLELLSSKRLELLKHIRVSETEASIKDLFNLWNNNNNEVKRSNNLSSSSSSSPKGRVILVDMKKWFADLSMNVVLRMVAGKRYCFSGGGGDGDEEVLEAERCQKMMRDFFQSLGTFMPGDAIPFLRWFDIGGHEKAMKRVGREMDEAIDGWLQEHRRGRNSTATSATATVESHQHEAADFMDVLLSAVDGPDELAGHHPDTIVKATCMGIIIGGSDTTAGMLTWALSLLLNNRDALRKAQEELDIHVGRERRRVDASDIHKLVYLQAIVKETLRLYPPGPLVGQRELNEDCTLGGYHIPKGTRLFLNFWKLQRDPIAWPEPLEFRPERFLTTHKEIDVKGHQFELIPFGSGRRICPGINLGLQMLHLVLANLLHAFDVTTVNDEAVDMAETGGLTSMKATPLQVLIAPRLSSDLFY